MLIIFIIFTILLLLHFRIDPNNPTQSDIQSLAYAKSKTPDYLYPQISHGFKQLSKGNIKPLNNLLNILPNNNETINIIRNNGRDVERRFYIPDYYRKDTLPQNDIGSEEMRPFVLDENTSETSWTDSNISDYPKYYTSDFKNNLTNPGTFFDKNNQFHDTTSSNTFTLPSDNCYVTKLGDIFCKDNTRIQNIPPALITDPTSKLSLNRIGTYKDMDRNDPSNILTTDKTLFDNVKASKQIGTNESYEKPLEPIFSDF